ncbi:dienelactone hydrolase family protein [Saccharolobus caldissimus]|uniref:Carboxymethylenebutenolidase n=1 Tax=Saccharolobus caldissimus TaxID=1702097 RepID=A0AAQ4CR51_9CREN|nr:dienelactone hydrolase family protein [Saccharolobus caldissimus]BDB98282.1 carboxymethylenebutenolidase [Saccharolobus caldissimus]
MSEREIFYESHEGKIRAFLASPQNPTLAVIVVHEIWGLNDNIKDISRRLANEGYMAFAPHLYTKYEDVLTPENIQNVMTKVWSLPPEKRTDPNAYRELMSSLNEVGRKVVDLLVINRQKMEEQMIKDLIKAYDYVNSLGVKKIVSMGFCMGGGLAFQLATEVPLDGTIVFYGRNPQPIEAIERIKGPILGLYAGEDPPINAGLPDLISAVIKYKKDLELKIYPGAYHAFFNDRGRSYNKAAAEDAWERVKNFLRRISK